MNKKKQDEATVRVHPFPTLIAQSLQLTALAYDASPSAVHVLANSALVFAVMSLECAATSCLEFTKIPKEPHGTIDRTLSVIDKFDLLHWLAVRASLDRGQLAVQKIDDLGRNTTIIGRFRRGATPDRDSHGKHNPNQSAFPAAAAGAANPSTTIFPLTFGVGQIGEVMPAATATFWPAPVS